MAARKATFTKGAEVASSSDETESKTFIVEVSSQKFYSPSEALESALEDAKNGEDSIASFAIWDAV